MTHTDTYHQPPPTWEATLLQALYHQYLKPIEALIDKKIRYWESLEATDRFHLSDADNQRLQRRMQDLATEIEALDNLLNAVPEFAATYAQHLDAVQQRAECLNDLYTSMFDSAIQTEERLLSILTTRIAA